MTTARPSRDAGKAPAENIPAGAEAAAPVPAVPVPATLAEALAAFQAVLPRIEKDQTAKVDGKDGKRGYSYNYADLASISEAVLPLLARFGLSFTSKPTFLKDGTFVLKYHLRHVSGESDKGLWKLPPNLSPQAIGGLLTYYRRYILCAITGVAPFEDDDDAAMAQNEYESKSTRGRAPRDAGDAWESAAPAQPRNGQGRPNGQQAGRPNGQQGPNSNGNGRVNGHNGNGGQPAAPHRPAAPQPPAPAAVGLPPEHPWAPKLDELVSAEDARAAEAELDALVAENRVTAEGAEVVRAAIRSRFPSPPAEATGPAEQALAGQAPAGPGHAASKAEEWITRFRSDLANAAPGDLLAFRRSIGAAVMDKTITPDQSAALTQEIAHRRRELEGASK